MGKLCEVCEFMGPIRKTETSFSGGGYVPPVDGISLPPAVPEKNYAQSQNPKHFDSGHKVPLYLCPPSIIIAIAHVIAQGHKKPGRSIYNWREAPINLSEYMSAAQRHLLKQIDGEPYDQELSELSGFPVRHEWAVASCMAIIVDARECGTLVDDLPKTKGGGAALLDRLTESNKKLLSK